MNIHMGVFLLVLEKYFRNLPNVHTDRLLLRKIQLTDAEDLFAYGSTEAVTRNVTWYPYENLEDAKKFITHVHAYYEAGKPAPWAIEHQETGKMIGTVGFGNVKEEHFVTEIAYAISEDFWGKGYTTEAVKEMLRIGFEELGFIRIEAQCLPENVASERVMQKVGMTYEGTLRKVAYIKGKNRDLKIYSILQEEYFLGNSRGKKV